MYYNSEYKKEAINKLIPYLLNFPQIVKITEVGADRYQAIENILWDIANNFKLNNARGSFLDIIAHNECTNIVYVDEVRQQDAFTYGSTWRIDNPDKDDEINPQLYGTGKYYSGTTYSYGNKINISEDKTIRAIKSQIIKNNTDGTIEDFIEAIKLYFNIDKVNVFESYPLNISLMIRGNNLEINNTGNSEIIKSFMPITVSLSNLYLNDGTYNIYQLGNNSYGTSRYPREISNIVSNYIYLSEAVPFRSSTKDYVVTNHNSIPDNGFCCISGVLDDIKDNSCLLSSLESDKSYLKVSLKENEFIVDYNGNITKSNIKARNGSKYTITMANVLKDGVNTFNVWISDKIDISLDQNKTLAHLKNIILNKAPDIKINNFIKPINAPVYINYDGTSNYCDFTYYTILMGNIEESNDISLTEQYTSCYGQKQILFNCLNNNNHLKIYTEDKLKKDIIVRQSDFNYNQKYKNGQCAYFDGKLYNGTDTSHIDYNIELDDTSKNIKELNLSFDLCIPFDNISTKIISNFTGINLSSSLGFNQDKKIELELGKNKYILSNININKNVFYKFRILIKENILKIYINNVEKLSQNLTNTLSGCNNISLGGNYFNGFIKNLFYQIKYNDDTLINLESNLTTTLRDDIYNNTYTNYGVRLITTPQLINDTTNLDLYGNDFVGTRK